MPPKMPMPMTNDAEPDAGPDEPSELDDLEQRVSALEDAVFGAKSKAAPAPAPAPSGGGNPMFGE